MNLTEEEKERYLRMNVPKPVVIGEFEISDEESRRYLEILERLSREFDAKKKPKEQ